jgi:diacylglycerol kinase (ATP)
MNSFKSKSGLTRIIRAFGYSLEGFRSAYQGEHAFRQEVWATAVLLPCAFLLGRSPFEWLLLIASLVLVLITELLNSGIEAAIDRISEEHHPLSKRAKDQASAAVFLAVALCLAVWLTVIYQRYWA